MSSQSISSSYLAFGRRQKRSASIRSADVGRAGGDSHGQDIDPTGPAPLPPATEAAVIVRLLPHRDGPDRPPVQDSGHPPGGKPFYGTLADQAAVLPDSKPSAKISVSTKTLNDAPIGIGATS